MSDLISRSKLIDYFYFGIDEKPIIDGISDRKIIDIIKNQPTAYDIDKVVEELEAEQNKADEKCKDIVVKDGHSLEYEFYNGKSIAYKHAIEIVKAGGKHDD